MKNLHTWLLIQKSLREQIPVMLLYVLESTGSSPGRQGFLMAVNAAGEMKGSVGGGIMEHKFTGMALDRLKEDEATLSVRRQVHDKSAARNQSGMICSGEQTILLYRIQPAEQPAIDQIIASLHSNTPGTLQLSPQGISFEPNSIPEKDFYFDKSSDEHWLYREKTAYKNQLFIIGGGHCGLALSQLMRNMDFYIRVYDTRPELPTFVQNESAHEKIILPDYNALTEQIPSDAQHHYAVIMTLGYRTDETALRALLQKDFKYLGLLGSKTKNEQLLSAFATENADPQRVARIHAPIGLPIHSQTPEEIAISIAAQIIQVKNA